MDGAAAQREIARRKDEAAQQEAARRSYEMQQGMAQREFYDRQIKSANGYSNYQSAQGSVGPYAKTTRQTHDLAKAAMESQRVDAVEDALRRTDGGKSRYSASTRASLEQCKQALNSGGQCDSSVVAEPPPPRVINVPPVANSTTSGARARSSAPMEEFGSQSWRQGTGGASMINSGGSTSSASGVSSNRLSSPVRCPDGSYVASGPCQLCPNGQYVGGGTGCQLTPNGSYVSRGSEPPRLMPNGSYVTGGQDSRLCPDGSYVAGTSCKLTPNGKYVGGN